MKNNFKLNYWKNNDYCVSEFHQETELQLDGSTEEIWVK